MLRGDEIMKNNTMRTLAVFILAGMIVLCAAGSVQAEPTMDIQIYKTQGDYLLENPGLENLWQYTVTNMSDAGSQNNMLDFTLPAGTNQGIFYAGDATSGWAVESGDPYNPGLDHMILEGLLTPGVSFTFDVYFTGDAFHQDYATATARGDEINVPFIPVSTDVPGEYPRTLEADIYFDGIVNLLDFAVLANEWMQEESWYSPPYTGGDGTTMQVTHSQPAIGNYDFDYFNIGDELFIQYTITNTSEPGTQNNMIYFTLPAGVKGGAKLRRG